jgi:hypothetical protein
MRRPSVFIAACALLLLLLFPGSLSGTAPRPAAVEFTYVPSPHPIHVKRFVTPSGVTMTTVVGG